jgi:hypothetical protein
LYEERHQVCVVVPVLLHNSMIEWHTHMKMVHVK